MAFPYESSSSKVDAATVLNQHLRSGDPAGSAARSRRTSILVGLCYAICCLIWGTNWYAIRITVEPGVGYPPNFAAAVRFAIAIILYIPLWFFFARKSRKPPLTEVSWVFIAGLLNGVFHSFMYSSECTISGGLTAVIMATSPLMVAAIAIAAKLEKVRWQTLVSFCVCFAGVTMVCLDRAQAAGGQAWGVTLALAAALFTSLSNITLKGCAGGMHPIVSAAIFLIGTDIPVWTGSLLCGETAVFCPLLSAPTLAVLYMAVTSSVLALLLYLYMIRHLSLMGISTIPFVLPVLALTVDLFLERRVALTPQAWIGIGIVLAGVFCSLRRR